MTLSNESSYLEKLIFVSEQHYPIPPNIVHSSVFHVLSNINEVYGPTECINTMEKLQAQLGLGNNLQGWNTKYLNEASCNILFSALMSTGKMGQALSLFQNIALNSGYTTQEVKSSQPTYANGDCSGTAIDKSFKTHAEFLNTFDLSKISNFKGSKISFFASLRSKI